MESLTFYFDRCFGRGFPKTLEILKCPFAIESHWSMKFPDDMPDDEWLAIAGEKKWIVLSHDAKWHTEGPNIAAIKDHKIGCFYLHGAQLPHFYKLKSFMRNYDKIIEKCKGPRPLIYKVTQQNRLRKLL